MGELAEPWSTAAEKAGVRQTYRGIGEAAGVSHVTVRRLITGGASSAATISAVAEALGVADEVVYKWAGVPLSEWGPWRPPAESHRLNPRARAALEELIRAITQTGGQTHGVESPDQKSVSGAAVPEELVASDQEHVTLAARREPSRGKMMHAEAMERGQEKQDDGGWEPA